MSKHNPSQTAGEQARELHKIAFPESYETDDTDKPADADPAIVPGADPVNTEPDAEQKYTALLNKYNQEVPRLHEWVRSRDQKITALSTELAESKTALEGLKNQTIADKVPTLVTEGEYTSPHVTDEMRASDSYNYLFTAYGQTHAERVTEGNVLVAAQVGKPMQEKLDKVSQNTEDLTSTTAEEQFHRELSGLAPSWNGLLKGVNVDPEFISWLQTPAPGTGANFHRLFSDAYTNANADAMAEIINLYATKKPQKSAAPIVPDELIVPAKTGGGQQQILDKNKGDVLYFSDMQQLYKDFNDGKYRGKEKEYQTKKDEYMKAQQEGRLVK
jgi:hypothetical protein